MRWLPALLLALLAACESAPPFRVEVADPHARPTRTGSAHSAAYFVLRNTGSEPVRLVGAATDGVRAVEVHRTVAANGVARMEPVDALDLPPGESAAFRPGGLHVMLIGVDGGLAVGDTLPLALLFASGDTARVAVPVR